MAAKGLKHLGVWQSLYRSGTQNFLKGPLIARTLEQRDVAPLCRITLRLNTFEWHESCKVNLVKMNPVKYR